MDTFRFCPVPILSPSQFRTLTFHSKQDIVSNPDSETIVITAKLFEKYERNVAYNLPHLVSEESRAGASGGGGSAAEK